MNSIAEYLLKALRNHYRKIMKPEDPFGLVPACPENTGHFGQGVRSVEPGCYR